jgi:hypothetical protein
MTLAGPDARRAIMRGMSEDNNDGFESGLRWLAQQVERSVEHLEEMDLDQIARAAGVDVDRAREFLDGAGQWLNSQAEGFVGEAGLRFSGFGDMVRGQDVEHGQDVVRREGPHPLDIPTAEQGLALSALDSGRWTVKPGSHLLVAHGEGPVPADALGLVGELRARDWINAEGEVTLVGSNALRRWMGHGDVT